MCVCMSVYVCVSACVMSDHYCCTVSASIIALDSKTLTCVCVRAYGRRVRIQSERCPITLVCPVSANFVRGLAVNPEFGHLL